MIDPFLESSLRGKLLRNEPLAKYTAWRTGGTAEYVYLPADVSDLSHFLRTITPDVPLTWLGLGSNTLIRDGGVDGIVLVTQGVLSQMAHVSPHEVRAEAGVASAQLARFTARSGKTGLEFLAGIPGTVGGALAMNAGCFGGETWGYVTRVETMNRQGDINIRTLDDFEIAYRHVIRPKDEWFIAGYFSLKPGDKELSLEQIRQFLEKRNQTQPTGTANCGSVFRNPSGHYAAKLIEECGLKGTQHGGAIVSHKHANFIINEKEATSNDIETLIGNVMTIVQEKTGVQLIPEVCIIGKDKT